MAQKCRHEACDQFARKLTGAEIRNLEQFNLSKDSCKEILFGTIKGLCPSHAASELPKDFQLSKSLMRNIDSCWDVSNLANFADAYDYAECSSCSKFLASDREQHPVNEVRDILTALDLHDTRIETILYLQTEAIDGHGKCFECCLKDDNLMAPGESSYDTLDGVKSYRSSKWEARYHAAQEEINEIKAKRGKSDHRHQKLNDLKEESQQLQTKLYKLEAESEALNPGSKIGEQALKRERFRTVETYKLYCEVSDISPDDAQVKKYEGLTDLFKLDTLANGYWELIHKTEGNELKPIPARSSQPDPPSETPSESTPLPDLREKAIEAYKSYREYVGRDVDNEALKMIENSTDVEMLTANTELYTDFTLGD